MYLNTLYCFSYRDKYFSPYFNWTAPGDTFPPMGKLLDIDNYRYRTMLGLCVSVGGLTESLVSSSSLSLLLYMQNISNDEEKIMKVCQVILEIFKSHTKTDRVILPLMKTLNTLMSNNCFCNFPDEKRVEFGLAIVKAVKFEIKGIGEPQKLLCAVDMFVHLFLQKILLFCVCFRFCSLLTLGDGLRQTCLCQISVFLGHKYPLVSTTT